MVGRHVSEIVHPELLAATEQIVSDSLAGQDGRVEVQSSLTGRTIVIQTAPVRMPDGTIEGIVVVSRDVTEQRLAERAGREAERRFEIAFDRAPIGMALIGVDASVERVNAALAGITGRSAEELAALRHEELLHPDDEELAAEAFASLLADDGMATELRIVHAEGHPVWVSLRATIVRDEEGTPVHVLVQVQDVTERRSLEDQLRHLADHDALTGLLNRRGLEERLAAEVARATRERTSLVLVSLDLDHFKRVNDEQGHEAGDRALAMVGAVIADHVRGADLAARWGGEEFVVVLPGADAPAARVFAERVRAAVAASGTGLTASAGVAVSDVPPDPPALLAAADAAMYAAKRTGRDRTVVADGGSVAAA